MTSTCSLVVSRVDGRRKFLSSSLRLRLLSSTLHLLSSTPPTPPFFPPPSRLSPSSPPIFIVSTTRRKDRKRWRVTEEEAEALAGRLHPSDESITREARGFLFDFYSLRLSSPFFRGYVNVRREEKRREEKRREEKRREEKRREEHEDEGWLVLISSARFQVKRRPGRSGTGGASTFLLLGGDTNGCRGKNKQIMKRRRWRKEQRRRKRRRENRGGGTMKRDSSLINAMLPALPPPPRPAAREIS
ncbi:unnamed protein product [Pleuronectes platessa]|uniref:Uncharacterized protein n=1 Tax=Pleuronectes platessa TaxID=8262 RepID=A0A9N7YVS7_PLEPL|nr:unnamed protein product [Pleuronectes platessa]